MSFKRITVLLQRTKKQQMNLHEYQGKSILESFGVAIQRGVVVDNAAEAVAKANQLSEAT